MAKGEIDQQLSWVTLMPDYKFAMGETLANVGAVYLECLFLQSYKHIFASL